MKQDSKTNESLELEIRKLRERNAVLVKQTSLLKENILFKTIIDSCDYGCILFDLDGRIAYVNNSFAQLNGYTPEEMQGQDLSCFCNEEQAQTFKEIINTTVKQGRCGEMEIEQVRRDGSDFTLSINAGLVSDENNRPEYIFVSTTNNHDWLLEKKANAQHVDFLNNLNLVDSVLRKSANINLMMSGVLQLTLDMFQTDRAWLLFPCDPDSEQWSIPMECTKPEFPGAGASENTFQMTDDIRRICQKALQSNDVVTIDSGSTIAPQAVDGLHSALSQIIIALHPQAGKPWLFGLHQCSNSRKWTTDETTLLREIGGRLSDALGTRLLLQTLTESEEKYRSLAQTSMEGIFFVKDGICVEANQLAADMFGWNDPSDLTGKAWLDIIAPESKNQAEQEILTHVTDEPYETTGIRKDGSKFPMIIHTKLIIYKSRHSARAVSVMDISQQKQTENLLRLERERAERYLNSANTIFVALDTKGIVTLVNKKACNILGRSEEYIIGKNWFDHFLPESVKEKTEHVFRRLITGEYERFEYFENSVLTAGGSERLIAWHNSFITDRQGVVSGFISAGNDITKYKQTEAEKLSLEKQVLHAQKLESLGILAGGIAHDFNNILMAILGNADLALMKMVAENPAYGNMKAIVTSAKRAADLAKQMLAYSGKGKFLVEAINLNHAVDEITHILEVSISKKTSMKFHYSDDLPLIEADATQVRQIIMNLVTNASDALGKTGGFISITTGTMNCDESYLSSTYVDEIPPPGQYVYLEVADTGCGMSRETISRMFEPFFTTKFTGRGLGLSAVLGIVKGHGGTINIYSEPGAGTSIKVLFPALTESQVQSSDKTEISQAAWTGYGTILLVDDEETILSVGEQMLKHMGFDVLTAYDGEQAVNIYKEFSDSITLVILDFIMPRLDGEETLRELRRIKEDVLVVMCSGYNAREINRRFEGKPPAGFLHKPYIFSELKSVLQQLINR